MLAPTSLLLLFTFLLCFLIPVHPQCPLAFTLPNLIKDLVTLTYSSGQQQSTSYPYFPSMFSSSPSLAYSISELDITSPGSFVNFYLNIVTDTMMFNFYFNAISQTWTHVTVNFWITSRNDLIVHIDTLQSIAPGQTASTVIQLTQYSNTALTINAKHTVFIVGLYATLIGSNLNLSVTTGPLTPTTATINVANGYSSFITNITISSVIFDPTTSQFLSYGGSATYSTFTQQALNLYNSFVPLYYYLLGTTAIAASGSNANYFGWLLDVTNATVLTLNAPNAATYDKFTASYLTIGALPQTICAQCNNTYISDSCVTQCPVGTYPYTYTAGGQACLECPSLVGLKINDLTTGCSCLPGYQYLSQYQCIPISSVPTNCSGQNLIQNGTVCICSPGTYNLSGQCQSCPSGQSFNGYQCIAAVCTGMNQVAGPQGICICQSGYYNVSSFCIQCPPNTIYQNGVCAPSSCQQNQVLTNGICVCDEYSVKVGQGCQACNTGSYPNPTNNQCVQCIANCANCTNTVACLLCNTNYVFDSSSMTCLSTAGENSTATVALRVGFPIYTPIAIVSDFIISSIATLPLMTSQQLANIVSIVYPQSQPAPARVIYQQNANNLNQMRVVFDYRCLLPMSAFVVSFSFNQPAMGLAFSLSVTYNTGNAAIRITIPD